MLSSEVKIDTPAGQDPEQTIRKMQQVKRAALAGQIEARARQEKDDLERAGP